MASQDHLGGAFVDLAALGVEPAEVLRALEAADWSAFVPGRDLAPLRDLLHAVEREHGITEAHRFATARLRALGAQPRHPHHHFDGISACALSTCGRYLATGSWGEDPGVLQIWEVATGRCVNALPDIEGGLGWFDEARTIQWSADNARVGMSFNTNVIGSWDPFGDTSEPIASADVTNGGGRPPAFALAPDGLRAYISVGTGDGEGVPGCVVPLVEGELDEGDEAVEPMAESLPPGLMAGREYGPEPPKWVAWSSDGTRIYGQDGLGEAFSIDARTRQLTWVAQAGDLLRVGTVGMPAAWSEDGRFLAHQYGELVIRDGVTGESLATFPAHPGEPTLHWGQSAKLAVAVREGDEAGASPAVTIYDGGELRHQLDIALPQWHDPDAPAWCWAPDGDRAAALTAAGVAEVHSLTGAPELLRTLDVPAGAVGLLWGVGDVLIALGSTALRFVSVATGEVLGDFTFPVDDGADTDESGSWLGVEDDELAELVEEHDDPQALDDTLAWTVDRRFAWPLRWS
ncbi:hypothetical protein ABT324_04720 [Saccharopolyspora sp. NPDC000359]|uniref:hypothetical protein n=1 Tax=Saccharopolyspora sp. NPDC000359 TaxID=3154251 RepID=UPI0033277D37